MEDLYGKTGPNKLELSLAGKAGRGRLTPVESLGSKAGRQSEPRPAFPPPGPPVMGGGPGLLNVSSHNSSKLSSSHSGSNATKTTIDLSHHELNSTQISPIGSGARRPLVDTSTSSSHINGGLNLTRQEAGKERKSTTAANVSNFMLLSTEAGVKEMLQSLCLLCLVSLLLALGSLVFLLKILPGDPPANNFLTQTESRTVYQVTVAMCALTLSLNLSCLLVCAIQFLFAAKLVKTSQGRLRTTKYLKKASITRTCAIAGFFLSIPLFLIGIVLFTFLHFHETPAIVTSIVIGLGIVFCGAAVIHNVFIWQREKTVSRKGSSTVLASSGKDTYKRTSLGQSHIVLPHATLDLSNGFNGTITAKSLELSTLV